MAGAHEPTDKSRNDVLVMAGYGLEARDIAIVVGCTTAEMTSIYAAELTMGDARAKVNLGKSVYEFAVGRPAQYDDAGRTLRAEIVPDRSTAIFMSKARLGFRDTEVVYVHRELPNLGALSDDELAVFLRLLEKADAQPGTPAAANDTVGADPGRPAAGSAPGEKRG